MTSSWPAPRALRPVDAVVALPGSKSVTNRALLLASLAEGTSTLLRPLRSRDTELMTAAMRSLGARIEDVGEGWRVTGTGGAPVRRSDHVDVGLAGTVARFAPPIAALADGTTRFDGDERMRERPMGALVSALRMLGVSVDAADGDRLPLAVHGAGGAGGVAGGDVEVDSSASSQVVSGLLLAAPCFTEGLTLRHVGPPLPSRPHVEMTVAMMRAAGADVTSDGDVWRVAPASYRAMDVAIEPDLSAAAPFLAAAVVTGGRVRVPGWPQSTNQPGARLPELLTAMGATCSLDDGGLTVVGPDRPAGLSADLRDCSELVPVLAAVAAFGSTGSRLTGIAHMRGHETDRLHALAAELSRLGARVVEEPDGLVVTPARSPLRGAVLQTCDDHRLAMAFAVVGLVVDGVRLDDVSVTAKTMPDFTRRWSAMLDADAT